MKTTPLTTNKEFIEERYEIRESRGVPERIKDLQDRTHDSGENKFDQMEAKINKVNDNVEVLKQKFSGLQMQQEYSNLKWNNVQLQVKELSRAVVNVANQRFDNMQSIFEKPIAAVERKVDTKLSTKLYLFTSLFWPLTRFFCCILTKILTALRVPLD